MAIVINPDGTVSTVDVYYNRDGSIKGIKTPFSTDKDYIPKSSPAYTIPRKKKKAKKRSNPSTPTINPKTENSSNVIVAPKPTTKQSTFITSSKKVKKEDKPNKPVVERAAEAPSLKPYFSSIVEIDQYITDKKNKEQTIALSEYLKIRKSLPGALCNYFTSKCKAYFIYCKEMSKKMMETATAKKKKKNKNKKNKKISNGVPSTSRRIQASKADVDNGSSFGGFIKKPKFGYARDKYGRVQERDSFNEEKKNEFFTAQNRQRNYDYSSYDANDDNDGAYGDWE